MKLRYTRRAARELDDILQFIDQRSPQGAHHVKARIRVVIELLLQYPNAGRATTTILRRVVAYPYPYVIFYRATATEIIIHGIRHSARAPLSDTDP